LVVSSLQSNIDPHKIEKSLFKKNVLKFEKEHNNTKKTYIYFWENNGKIIERMNIPVKTN